MPNPNFTVEDITFVSPKTQAGNIAQAHTSYEESILGNTTQENGAISSRVPQAVTLESAICFFEENAVGEYANLYKFTAKMLMRAREVKPVVASAKGAENE